MFYKSTDFNIIDKQYYFDAVSTFIDILMGSIAVSQTMYNVSGTW
jgi:hypothetical protein